MNLKIFRAVFAIILVGAVFAIMQVQRQKQEKAIREAMGEPDPASMIQSKRLDEFNNIRYSQPDKAIELLDAILAKPDNAAEKAKALEEYPKLLLSKLEMALSKNDIDATEPIYNRLEKEFSTHYAVNTAFHDLRQFFDRKMREAATSGDETALRRWLDQLTAGRFYLASPYNEKSLPSHDGLASFHSFQVRQAQSFLQSGNEASAISRCKEAAGIFEPFGNQPLIELLRHEKGWNKAKVLELARKIEADGTWALSIPFYVAANMKHHDENENPPLTWQEQERLRQEIDLKIVEYLMRLSQEVQGGKPSVLTACTPMEILRQGNNCQTPAAQSQLLGAQIDLFVADFSGKSLPFLDKPIESFLDRSAEMANESYEKASQLSESYYEMQRTNGIFKNDILNLVKGRLEVSLSDLSFDPWPEFPPALKEEIQARIPPETDDKRKRELMHSELRQRINQGDLIAPMKNRDRLIGIYNQLLARMGFYNISHSGANYSHMREEGASQIRQVIRSTNEDTLMRQIEKTFQTLLKKSHASKDLVTYLDLAGFYSTELLPRKIDSSFHPEYKQQLNSTADHFSKIDQMKHLFALSILADAFPDDPQGVAAKKNALKLAFDYTQSSAIERPVKQNAPSSMEAFSVAAIDNSTTYPILCFLDGQEEVFVLVKPLRRGSMILPNGTYRLAVVAPTEKIRPYRSELKLHSECEKLNFIIDDGKGKGTKDPLLYAGSSAWGDYQWLKIPSSDSFRLNVKTGEVSLAAEK